jgi:aarF domain-containing kinase
MPIGSGCIGQVYKWVLKNDAVNDKSLLSDGESDHLTVAVKVLHPNVTELVLRDVLLMSWIASWIDYMCPDVYWVSLRECVHEFGEVMKKQLDLRLEAHNMKILKECFATHDYVRIPTPIDSLVDKSILVETFEEGINISEYLKKPPTQFHKQIASLGIDTILHMVIIQLYYFIYPYSSLYIILYTVICILVTS